MNFTDEELTTLNYKVHASTGLSLQTRPLDMLLKSEKTRIRVFEMSKIVWKSLHSRGFTVPTEYTIGLLLKFMNRHHNAGISSLISLYPQLFPSKGWGRTWRTQYHPSGKMNFVLAKQVEVIRWEEWYKISKHDVVRNWSTAANLILEALFVKSLESGDEEE